MARIIRWGILSTGSIANKFALGLSAVDDARLVAVGSRSRDSADAFARKHGAARAHASYEALAADPEVDVIYIATPHSYHLENTLLCLAAGKNVLCEKPFTINAAQARRAVDVARSKKLFLMEAVWTRFLPSLVKLRELIAAGALGEIRAVAADFGFRAGFNPKGRLFKPELGGGSLLDVGIYTVSLASMVLGRPDDARLATLAQLGQTGVDEQAAFILAYPDGRLATLFSAVRTHSPMEATIMGTDAFVRLHYPWWKGAPLSLHKGGETHTFDLPVQGNGYNYEAIEVGRCLRDGLTESPVMPLDETLSIMATLDRIRAAWGLKYPME